MSHQLLGRAFGQALTHQVFNRFFSEERYAQRKPVPFPCGSADVIFCRLLLSHLKEPEAAAARWATELNPGGFLIRTARPVFARYIKRRFLDGGART